MRWQQEENYRKLFKLDDNIVQKLKLLCYINDDVYGNCKMMDGEVTCGKGSIRNLRL